MATRIKQSAHISWFWLIIGTLNCAADTSIAVSKDSPPMDLMLLALSLLTVFVLYSVKKLRNNVQPRPNSDLRKPIDPESEMILATVKDIWSSTEEHLTAFYDDIATQSLDDIESLKAYLEKVYADTLSGSFLDYKVTRPFDCTIWAVDEKGIFLFHSANYYVGTKLEGSHPHARVLAGQSGEFLVADQNRSPYFRNLAKKAFRGARLTKVYYRSYPALNAIVVFERHINLIHRLKQMHSLKNLCNKRMVVGSEMTYQLNVLSGIYKGRQAQVDVTAKLSQKISNNTLELVVSNDLFGDPDPGFIKTLEVRYSINATEFIVQVAEEETLFLP